MTTRREFLGGASVMIAAATAPGQAAIAAAPEKLDILFLGGTGFIGPHQIEYALARGHNVSMFNRGRRQGMYEGRVEQLVGNRDASVDDGLSVLEGDRTWDVVIDNSGYIPRHVSDSADMLKNRCGRYIYTSTVAVYDFEKVNSVDIDSPLLPAPSPVTEEVTGQTYGPLKAECDRVAMDILGDRLTIVRPTYIIGPGDTSDRFTYWVERFNRGGDIVCPSGPELDAQWIDVRDLCHWLVSLGETDTQGIFNAVAPEMPVTREEVMHGIKATTSAGSRLHWPSADLLEEMEYSTPMFPNRDFSRQIDSSHAERAGLTFRPLADSVRDTHEWWNKQPAERRANPRRWPTPEQEAAVLTRMKA